MYHASQQTVSADGLQDAAPTGMAAFLIGGRTLHILLKLPLRAGRALTRDSLKRLQQSLNDVDHLIIDELSMVSQSQFAWVDRRLRQATGRTDEVFGGICVIMTGDPGQLPPVCGRALHAGHSKDQLSHEGFSAYRSFRHVLILLKFSVSSPRKMATERRSPSWSSFLARVTDVSAKTIGASSLRAHLICRQRKRWIRSKMQHVSSTQRLRCNSTMGPS